MARSTFSRSQIMRHMAPLGANELPLDNEINAALLNEQTRPIHTL